MRFSNAFKRHSLPRRRQIAAYVALLTLTFCTLGCSTELSTSSSIFGMPGDLKGYWIRESDEYATMVMHIQRKNDKSYSARLLHIPVAGLTYGFTLGDEKLKNVISTAESRVEFEGQNLVRLPDTEPYYNDVLITLLDSNKLFMQEKVHTSGIGAKQHWHRISDNSVEMAYVHFGEAKMALERGDYSTAGTLLAKAAKTTPKDASLLNDLAWTLAVNIRSEIRLPEAALQLARKACELDRNASYLDTLAAAQAAQGNFSEAVITEEKAIKLLEEVDFNQTDSSATEEYLTRNYGVLYAALHIKPSYLKDFSHRLELYRANKPYLE
jgi:tetratricopeptide (TPR) repeat protein